MEGEEMYEGIESTIEDLISEYQSIVDKYGTPCKPYNRILQARAQGGIDALKELLSILNE